MSVIVCDTGPLLHLAEADLLDVLFRAGQILCPPGVHHELRQLDSPSERFPCRARVTPLDAHGLVTAEGWADAGILDRGEAEALALSQQVNADWFLTDDTAARLLAKRLGVEVHGSLGVILWGAATGNLDQEAALAGLDRLAESTLWISNTIVEEARVALQSITTSRA